MQGKTNLEWKQKYLEIKNNKIIKKSSGGLPKIMWKNDEYVEYVRPKCFDNDLSSTRKKKHVKKGEDNATKTFILSKIWSSSQVKTKKVGNTHHMQKSTSCSISIG